MRPRKIPNNFGDETTVDNSWDAKGFIRRGPLALCPVASKFGERASKRIFLDFFFHYLLFFLLYLFIPSADH